MSSANIAALVLLGLGLSAPTQAQPALPTLPSGSVMGPMTGPAALTPAPAFGHAPAPLGAPAWAPMGSPHGLPHMSVVKPIGAGTAPGTVYGPNIDGVQYEDTKAAPGSPLGVAEASPNQTDEVTKLTSERDLLKIRVEVADLQHKLSGSTTLQPVAAPIGLSPALMPGMAPAPVASPNEVERRELPTVLAVVGLGNSLRARVQNPSGSVSWLRRGDLIGDGMRVSSVEPDGVHFRSTDGHRSYVQPVSTTNSAGSSPMGMMPFSRPMTSALATPMTPGSGQ